MAAFKTLDDLTDISGKRVLVRVDLNVPVKDGKVTDATCIERVAPTILELSEKGAKVILLAHFGRPKDGPSRTSPSASSYRPSKRFWIMPFSSPPIASALRPPTPSPR